MQHTFHFFVFIQLLCHMTRAQDTDSSFIHWRDHARVEISCPGCILEELHTSCSLSPDGKEKNTYVQSRVYKKTGTVLTIMYSETGSIRSVLLEHYTPQGIISASDQWEDGTHDHVYADRLGADSVDIYISRSGYELDTLIHGYYYDHRHLLILETECSSAGRPDSTVYWYDQQGRMLRQQHRYDGDSTNDSTGLFYYYDDSLTTRQAWVGLPGCQPNVYTYNHLDSQGRIIYQRYEDCHHRVTAEYHTTYTDDAAGRPLSIIVDGQDQGKATHREQSYSYSPKYDEQKYLWRNQDRNFGAYLFRSYYGARARKMKM